MLLLGSLSFAMSLVWADILYSVLGEYPVVSHVNWMVMLSPAFSVISCRVSMTSPLRDIVTLKVSVKLPWLTIVTLMVAFSPMVIVVEDKVTCVMVMS